MPSIIHTLVLTPSAGSLASGSESVRALVRALKQAWSAYRDAEAHRRMIADATADLTAMDDMMLADIGISRCAIASAVAEPHIRRRR